MIDPQTGAWRAMIDPTTRKPGQALQLTVGHVDGVGGQLFAHEDADQARVHPVELLGDLYQTRTVLRCLEDALWRHPLHDYFGDEEMDALADPQARAYDAVNEARRIVDACWEQQTEILHPATRIAGKAPERSDEWA